MSTLGRHHWWDTYILVKHVSELAILVLMLYKLQGKKTSRSGGSHAHHHHHGGHGTGVGPGSKDIKPNKREYVEVKDLEEGMSLQHKAANSQAPH